MDQLATLKNHLNVLSRASSDSSVHEQLRVRVCFGLQIKKSFRTWLSLHEFMYVVLGFP